MKTVAIILNTPDKIATVNETDIICADGGYKHVSDKNPIAIIGDFDSISAFPTKIKKISYNPEKNQTDGQLAIDYAAKLGYKSISIYGALGGRIDHILGNLGLLLYANSLHITAKIIENDCIIELFTSSFRRKVSINDKISFYPFGGDVFVSNSSGLYYPLNNLLLESGTNRGISNVAVQNEIGLDFSQGQLLYIRLLNLPD